MAVEEEVRALANKVAELKDHVQTEEATKNAFIGPFIKNVLGYDIEDPREVIPEYIADVGKKKGEKVDYAIKSGEDFRFLIECKPIGTPLNIDHADQLVRYFTVTNAAFAILTNGEQYQFYTELDEKNRMDEKPFMVLDLSNIDARILPSLEQCTKANFDAGAIMNVAEQMKYVAEAKRLLASSFKDPSEDWVRMFASRLTTKRMTPATMEFFTHIVTLASSQYLNDEANRRLRSAQMEEPMPLPEAEIVDQTPPAIVTTEEELQGFYMVQAIATQLVSPSRVIMRDGKTYCSILLDDNNRKPILKFHFNGKKLDVRFIDEQKNESQVILDRLEDLYQYRDLIILRIQSMLD